ncbi:MAG: hypothetical protein HOG49_05570 [Candidatus Scalindua sp.]|jgi:hypothetical protein|nr:hypothetical protein [Candidatus Scalindua sp.]
MSEKLKQLEEQLKNAQKNKDNWHQCMVIQMAISKEKNATNTTRVHTRIDK